MLEIGSSLREARRRRKLELAEVERATRIRVQQLAALEQERFELLPPDPYRRSFLREYADFLGLDGDLYTTEYDLRFRPPEPQAPSPPARRSAAAPRRLLRLRPLPTNAGLALAGLIVIVAMAAVALWQLGRPGASGTRVSTTLPHRQHRAASSKPRHAATPLPPAKRAATLVLTAARGSCWLWVRLDSGTGPTVYQQTLQPGATVRFGLHRRLWLRLGAPWNLDATIGHRSLTTVLPARTANVYATAAGLAPAP
jgi:transcriptional regulator with XRE-family HTH domain